MDLVVQEKEVLKCWECQHQPLQTLINNRLNVLVHQYKQHHTLVVY